MSILMDKILFSIKKIIPSRLFQYLQPWYHFVMALCAALMFGFPSRKLIVIGVTGTKGKTTVVELLHEIFAVSGTRVASLSSLRFKINDDIAQNDKKMTMPGRFFTQRFLWRARRAKCRYVILEVTSEGIKQFRHRFIHFAGVVMTNMAPEHIEAHGGFEQYVRAKLDLLWRLDSHAVAIINRDDPLARRFAAATAAHKIYYGKRGIEGNSMNWDLRDLHVGNKGIQFELNKQSFSSPLLGEFNFYNIMAAIAVAHSQHIAIGKIAEGVARVAYIPGRLEFVQHEPFSVVVDYAHTPDSLRSVYETFAQEQKKLICVLGAAGGGRDRWKRPAMGKIAQEFCREIILTNEDPYDEDPNAILEDIESGIFNFSANGGSPPLADRPASGGQFSIFKILDRREAIRIALSHAQKNDCVIITGKGAEPWIMGPNGTKTPWNEKEIVEEELRKIPRSRIPEILQ